MNTRYLLLGSLIAVAAACGGTTPIIPTPLPEPDPGPVVSNTPPTIGTFRVQGSRPNEPANFADVSEEVAVSVTVTDPESAVTDLTFNWSADLGTFKGSGAAVTWTGPSEAAAPAEVTINLEVVETFTSQGKSVENKVTGSTTIMLHDSVREVSELARQFLLDFSDSSLGVADVMRNFEPDCYGTADETLDVTKNRDRFTIIDSRVSPARTTVGFGGVCAFRGKRGDACARVPVYWKSVAKKDLYNDFTGQLDLRRGEESIATGVDQVAAMYYREQKRWRLCDSAFDPDSSSLKASLIRGLVP